MTSLLNLRSNKKWKRKENKKYPYKRKKKSF